MDNSAFYYGSQTSLPYTGGAYLYNDAGQRVFFTSPTNTLNRSVQSEDENDDRNFFQRFKDSVLNLVDGEDNDEELNQPPQELNVSNDPRMMQNGVFTEEDHQKLDYNYQPSEFDLYIASRLLKDAIENRNFDYIKEENTMWYYKLYLNKLLVGALYLIVVVHILVLPIFEHPAVMTNTPFWIPNLVEFVFLIIYMLRWFHSLSFQRPSVFFRRFSNYIVPVTVFLVILDLIQFIVVNSIHHPFQHRFTRSLRILFYMNLNVGDQLKRALKNLTKTIPAVTRIYLLFVFTLLSFTYLVWTLFKDRNLVFATGEEYFRDYGDSLWGMYVSITTANFPDIMQPAYNFNGLYSLIFLSFMCINLYLFANMFLASISSSFKENLKTELKATLRVKRQKIEDAFNLTKTRVSGYYEPLSFAISFFNFSRLMKLVDPSLTDRKVRIIFKVLDFQKDNRLHLNEFLYTAETLTFRITEKEERMNIFEKYIPNVYNSWLSRKTMQLVRTRAFEILFDIFILVNAITVVVPENSIAWIFWSAFIVEMCLKIYSFGFREFFSRYLNWLDLFFNIGGIITTILVEGRTREENFIDGTFDVAIVFRMLNLIRLLANIEIFKKIFKTLASLRSSILTYGTMLLAVYYVFVMIGMEIFGDLVKTKSTFDNGTIDCSNPDLINTPFALSLYCKNNFNNIFNGFVLAFEYMVVNNWNVLTTGFVAATNKWVRLFFIINHTVTVFISLNILTSIILEEFWLDIEVGGKTVIQTRMEKRIVECSLDLDEENKSLSFSDVYPHRSQSRNLNKPQTTLGEVLETYDNKPTRLNKDDIKFDIKHKRHKSIEMLFQKRLGDQLNLAQDDISA